MLYGGSRKIIHFLRVRRCNADVVGNQMAGHYVRSEEVVTALYEDGAFLHHLGSDQYVELDRVGRKIWEMMDGTVSSEEIERDVSLSAPAGSAGSNSGAREIIDDLIRGGFLEGCEAPRPLTPAAT